MARPELSALEQDIYWSPRADPAVLVLGATPGVLVPGSVGPVSPRSPDGAETLHRAIHRQGAASRIVLLTGATTFDPLSAVIPLDDDLLGRVEALLRFWRGWRGLPASPDTRLTANQRRRLRLMLQASDGRAVGASYRAIATALYGDERVAAESWKTSSLRDAVIGLVQSGVAMIAGGYLQLLRHRRRR